MKYHELTVSHHAPSKRLGRGIASGKGKTAGRGTKGQGSRAGSSKRPGFEGGQNPLMQRLPKLRGFKNHRPKAVVVYTGQLEQLSGKVIDAALLAKHGLIASPYDRIKLIAKGDLTKKVTVKLQAGSASAIAAIQQAGGVFEVVPRAQQSKRRPQKPQE
jgi:large subunit ribosomal protein L15